MCSTNMKASMLILCRDLTLFKRCVRTLRGVGCAGHVRQEQIQLHAELCGKFEQCKASRLQAWVERHWSKQEPKATRNSPKLPLFYILWGSKQQFSDRCQSSFFAQITMGSLVPGSFRVSDVSRCEISSTANFGATTINEPHVLPVESSDTSALGGQSSVIVVRAHCSFF